MNKKRRKELENICDGLSSLHDRLQAVADQEQEAYDNMPENLQGGGLGEQLEQNVLDLTDAYDYLESVIGLIEDILDTN